MKNEILMISSRISEKYEMKSSIDLIFLIFLFLLPFSIMDSGKLFKNIVRPLFLLILFYKVYKDGLKTSFYEKYMLIFVSMIIISCFFSPYNKLEGIKRLGDDIFWLLMPTLFGQFKVREKEFEIILCSIYLGSINLFLSYLQEIKLALNSYLGLNIGVSEVLKIENWSLIINLSEKMWRLGREKPFIYIAHNAAVLSIIIITLAVYIIFGGGNKYKKIVAGCFLPPLFIFLALTQSRSAYVALIAITIVILITNIKRISNKVIFIIFAIFLAVAKFFEKTPYAERLISLKKLDNSNIGRLEVYKESLNIFKKYPITGVGYENFHIAQNKSLFKIHTFGYSHPHNIYLKFLSETGTIGFLGYSLMLFKMCYEFYKEKKSFQGLLGLVICIFIGIFENFELLIYKYKIYVFVFIFFSYSLNIFYEKIKKR